MLMSLAGPTTPTHQHDFPRHTMDAPHDSAMDDGHLFTHPLSYLQARLQAFTILGTNAAPKAPLPEVPASSEPSINGTEDVGDVEHEAMESSPPPRPISLDSRRTSSRLAPSTTTTTFQMAHPPPVSKTQQRFSVRAKPLLQLRQMSARRSPRPIADILPLATLTPNLAKLMPRRRGVRRGHGREDLVMVKCGTYTRAGEAERSEGEESEDESGKNREVAAAIYNVDRIDDPTLRGAEICVGQGPSWMASVLPGHAGYEFVALDEHGVQLRARWVPTKKSKHRRTQTQLATVTAEMPERRYRFSVLTAGERRHPVIGYIDRSCISVCDQYVVPTTPPLPRASEYDSPASATPQTPLDAYFDPRGRPAEGDLVDTDAQLRTLILATGVWVALVEGWSDAFKYIDAAATVSSPTAPARVSPQLRALRTTSAIITSTATTDVTLPSPRIRHPSLPPLHHTAPAASPRSLSRLGSLPQRARSFATRQRNSFASSERPTANDLSVAAATAAAAAAAASPASRRADFRGASATSLGGRASSDVAARFRSEDGGSVREAGSWRGTPTGSARGDDDAEGEPGEKPGQPKRIRRMLRFMNRRAGG